MLSLRQGRRLNRTGRFLLAVAALAAPLCLGGIPVWVSWVCAPLAFGALALALVGREHLKLPLFPFVPLGVAALPPLLGLAELFGVYAFVSEPRLFTGFGNVNHLASFLILCGTLSVALAIEADDRRRRSVWLAVFATCSLGVLLSLSRAG